MQKINKILFITLSNIGDAVLTLPTLDLLRRNFPKAELVCLCPLKPRELFERSLSVDKLMVYDKHAPLRDKIRLFMELNKQDFDMVVDLRNSLFGAFLGARYRTSPFLRIPKYIKHMRERHLFRLMRVEGVFPLLSEPHSGFSLKPSLLEEVRMNLWLKEEGITNEGRIILVGPGARSHIKRWPAEKFCKLIPMLANEFCAKVVLCGDKQDQDISSFIVKNCGDYVIDLTGRTSLTQLAHLVKRALLVITNDSALLHLASYLDRPIVALFGPTDETKYGPWSQSCAIVKKEVFCRPCQRPQCRYKNIDCMQKISINQVMDAAGNVCIGTSSSEGKIFNNRDNFKRILVSRTDRLGDVVLSIPAIKALRDNYPDIYIAMLVSPQIAEILKDNPWLDEIIVYDKNKLQRSFFATIRFIFSLRKRKFDLVLVLHPNCWVHIMVFLAGIRRRIGYDRKCSIFLTEKIKHLKQLGEKHELEYVLDLVRRLGIRPHDYRPVVFLNAKLQDWAVSILEKEGVGKLDKIMAVHPSASCISKIWPAEKFADAARALSGRYNFKKVLILAGAKDIKIAEKVSSLLGDLAVDFSGKTDLRQLAALLWRVQLFLSNDSGPVHVASAVGTPVISIFGRNQKGLSPRRWGPVGPLDRVLHKEVGCVKCLAHRCQKGFLCLQAIEVSDVLEAASSIFVNIARDTF